MIVQEPTVAYGRKKYSIEEYLEMENAATDKHEYYQGDIFAMFGAKSQHNIVTSNLHVSIGTKLSGKPCRPFNSDLRIHIEKNTLFTYPDLTIVCGELISLNNDDLNFLNPSIIFEVLSPSTSNYDRNAKFELYKDIPTLSAYILVDPAVISIEAFSIDNSNNWVIKEYNNIDQLLDLSSIHVSVALKDIYEGTAIAG